MLRDEPGIGWQRAKPGPTDGFRFPPATSTQQKRMSAGHRQAAPAPGRVRSQEECLISAAALDGALHLLDDDESAERLADLPTSGKPRCR